jgi:hypothetical protein
MSFAVETTMAAAVKASLQTPFIFQNLSALSIFNRVWLFQNVTCSTQHVILSGPFALCSKLDFDCSLIVRLVICPSAFNYTVMSLHSPVPAKYCSGLWNPKINVYLQSNTAYSLLQVLSEIRNRLEVNLSRPPLDLKQKGISKETIIDSEKN